MVQSSHIPVLYDPPLSPERMSLVAGPSSPELLLRLLSLMRRCLSLSKKDMTRMTPAPCSTESDFIALKDELDTLCIRHADDRVLDTETLENLQTQEADAGYYVMCLSMFHASMHQFCSAVLEISLSCLEARGSCVTRHETCRLQEPPGNVAVEYCTICLEAQS